MKDLVTTHADVKDQRAIHTGLKVIANVKVFVTDRLTDGQTDN